MSGFALHAVLTIILACASTCLVVGLPGPFKKLYTGCPGAGGSGLPEVKTYLSGAIDKPRMEQFRTLVAKVLSLSLLVASGVPASRDMIHIAALVATNVVNFWASKQNESALNSNDAQNRYKYLLTTKDALKFVFVSAGVASGVGASFRCPFAGVMFAFEGFSSLWSKETASMALLASAIASLTAWYLSGSDSKSAWYLADFEDTSGDFDPLVVRMIPAAFARVAYPSLRVEEVVILLLLGVLGGLWGSVFVLVNGKFLGSQRRTHMAGPWMKQKRLIEMALVALFCSAVSVLLPALWPCRALTDAEQSALVDKGQRLSWKISTCPEGFVNEMASLVYQGQGTTLNNLFAESEDMQFSFLTLFVYGAVYFIVTCVSVGTSSPAGAVVPMILSGAAWGRAIGVMSRPLFDYTGNKHPHVRFFGVMGGAASLAGFFRLPMAVTALIVEMTGNTPFTAPLFLCCTIARVVADKISVSFVNFMCQFNDFPLLKQDPPSSFRHHTAFDIMSELDKGVNFAPHMIGASDGIDHARKLLATKHGSFPVVQDRASDWRLQGMIGRRELAALVDKASEAERPDAVFRKCLASERKMSPPTVNEGMPAERVYAWFVSMGLRRMFVVQDGTMQVTGVITRHDLHEASLQWLEET
mmetsp:Transcript_17395/g.48023  ORF Transcript_17395/g.48023 Transcript_17395/m.48023 type:complete len:643 (-) Transcript_17395:816-2744(-)